MSEAHKSTNTHTHTHTHTHIDRHHCIENPLLITMCLYTWTACSGKGIHRNNGSILSPCIDKLCSLNYKYRYNVCVCDASAIEYSYLCVIIIIIGHYNNCVTHTRY